MNHFSVAARYASIIRCKKSDLSKIWARQLKVHNSELNEYSHNMQDQYIVYDMDRDSPEKIGKFLSSHYTIYTK